MTVDRQANILPRGTSKQRGWRVERNRARDRLVSIVRLPVPSRYFLLANVVNSMEMCSKEPSLDSFTRKSLRIIFTVSDDLKKMIYLSY